MPPCTADFIGSSARAACFPNACSAAVLVRLLVMGYFSHPCTYFQNARRTVPPLIRTSSYVQNDAAGISYDSLRRVFKLMRGLETHKFKRESRLLPAHPCSKSLRQSTWKTTQLQECSCQHGCAKLTKMYIHVVELALLCKAINICLLRFRHD